MKRNLTQIVFLLLMVLFAVVTAFARPVMANALEKFSHQPLNGVAESDSPYLRQHGRDLVQWHAWNAKTLQKAIDTGKPVFVSIGYSACHWCHVMQVESFNNASAAKLLNEKFIAILVDREQRPGLDETYMLATEAISGRGGWPNNVLLTPDLKPFYGGVYFPPENLIKLLTLISQDWQKDRLAIQLEADRISEILAGVFSRKIAGKAMNEVVLKQAGEKILSTFSDFGGGIGTAPKHFYAPALRFLMYLAEAFDREGARSALITTLDAIGAGGVRDHLAGGFHRYAVDANWRIPHFEKMLYDQAMLSELYVRAAVLTGKNRFAKVARSTLDYVLDDLTSPQGGFYSTRDAPEPEE